MKKTLAFLVVLLFTVSIGMALAGDANVVQPFKGGYINWTKGMIKAIGIGVPSRHARTEAQGKAMARRAAIVDGQRNLAEIIKGVQVDSETTVKNMEVESDVVRTKVSAFIKGAQVLDVKEKADGSVEVTMGVPMYGEDSLGSIVYEEEFKGAPAECETPAVEAPKTEEPAATEKPCAMVPEVTESYTGLIVDCVGLKVYSAMSPRLIDEEGTDIYGKMKVSPKFALNVGIVGYWHSVEEAKKDTARVGNNPLIIKATGKKGEGFFAVNPVIKTTDGLKVVTANQTSHFLNECKVLFAIDPQFQ